MLSGGGSGCYRGVQSGQTMKQCKMIGSPLPCTFWGRVCAGCHPGNPGTFAEEQSPPRRSHCSRSVCWTMSFASPGMVQGISWTALKTDPRAALGGAGPSVPSLFLSTSPRSPKTPYRHTYIDGCLLDTFVWGPCSSSSPTSIVSILLRNIRPLGLGWAMPYVCTAPRTLRVLQKTMIPHSNVTKSIPVSMSRLCTSRKEAAWHGLSQAG